MMFCFICRENLLFLPSRTFFFVFSLFGFPEIMLTKGNFISFVGKFIPWENLICGKIQFLLWFSFSSEAQYQLYQSWFLQILYFYEEIVRGGGQDQAGNTAPNWWYFKFRSATLYLTKKEKDCLCSKVD